VAPVSKGGRRGLPFENKSSNQEGELMSGKTLTDDVKNRSAWTFFMGVVTAALGVLLIVYR
jgi:hypothetical protein